MSYSNSEVAHKWVHGNFNGEINGSNMSGDNVSMKSYSTTICQCLDRTRNVFLLIDESLTPTTSKHVGYVSRAIPNSWFVIRTHFDSGSYYYDHVNLLGWRGTFDKAKRLELVSHLLTTIYNQYENVLTGRGLETENISRSKLRDIERLHSIYGDCSLAKWLKSVNQKKSGVDMATFKRMRVMVKHLMANSSDEEIADAMFGAGTWAEMQKRIAPLKKGRETREKIERFVLHLGYRPLRSHSWEYKGKLECPYTAKELRELKPREILDIRFRNIMLAEAYKQWYREHGNRSYDEPKSHRDESYRNARKFIGFPTGSGCYYNREESCYKPDGTMVYKKSAYNEWNQDMNVRSYSEGEWWDNISIEFSHNGDTYKSFCAAPDKFMWRERFWRLCELKMRRIRGAWLYGIMKTCEDAGLTFSLDEEDNHIYNEFVVRLERHKEDEAMQKELARAAREREERMRLEQIEEFKKLGIDGVREMWRRHLQEIPYEVRYSQLVNYGGNVLLRFAKQDGIIETSKGIRINFKEAKKYFAIIKKWHDRGTFEQGISMAGYRVQSFRNDILTAGCHQIAYCEMERMYQELLLKEAA